MELLEPLPLPELEENLSGSCEKPFLYFIGRGAQKNTVVFYVKIKNNYHIMHRRSLADKKDGIFTGTLQCSESKLIDL